METEQLKPSKYISVHGDTTIEECLSLMNKKHTSFVLVKEPNKEIEGIFTLKDLLKYFSYLRQMEYLERPVRVVMTRPVSVLPADRLHQAADIMVQNGIRHLPIVTDLAHQSEVIGVIDMQSLLKTFVEDGSENRKREMNIGVYSPDGFLMDVIHNSFQAYKKIEVEKFWLSRTSSELQKKSFVDNHDIFMCDLIDHTKFDDILELIELFTVANKKSFCFVAKTMNQTEEHKEFIKSLENYINVSIYEKPIHIQDVISDTFAE